MIRTIHFLDEYAYEIEADFQDIYHGLDLLDLYRGKLSLRKVHSLIQRLLKMPGKSALLMACDETAEWGTTEHLLARLIDEVQIDFWAYASGMSDEDVPKPDPIPRPGVKEEEEPEEKEFASPQQVAQFMASIKVGGFV